MLGRYAAWWGIVDPSDATARTALIRPTAFSFLLISGLWHHYKTGHGSTRSCDGRRDRNRQSLRDL